MRERIAVLAAAALLGPLGLRHGQIRHDFASDGLSACISANAFDQEKKIEDLITVLDQDNTDA